MAIDIAVDENAPFKGFLRERSPRQLRLPQIWVDRAFRADYGIFYEAIEDGVLEELFKSEDTGGVIEEEPIH